MLPGLEKSPALDSLVAARHHTTAKGICHQNDITYLSVDGMQHLQPAMDALLNTDSNRPVLLEAFTDAAEDERVYRDYYHSLSI